MRLGYLLLTAAAMAHAQTPPAPPIPAAAKATPAPPAPNTHGDMNGMAGMNHDDMTAPKTPMLMEGYGTGGFPITTKVPQAQAFFDNGMQLAHAFAHKAAIGAMAEAVRLDPACAMCVWGQAWASGPTINYGKKPGEIDELAKLADKADTLAQKAGTDREKALIAALKLRYKDGGGGKPGDLAFAKAMQVLAERYPDDREIAILTADAWLMAPHDTREDEALNARLAIPLLERALAAAPNDTGAIHFYIHATEIAGEAAEAEPYASRLAALAPRASHLVHMPSHTFYWVGRYQDAADTNMRAVEIGIDNAKTLGLPPPDGVWGLPYHAHNVTYGLGGALMSGDSKTALALGRPLIEQALKHEDGPPYMQLLSVLGYDALGLYADPAEVLKLPQPKAPYLLAGWHYARGEALARKGDAAAVAAEAQAIHGAPGKIDKDDGGAAAQQMTFIARDVLTGRAAMMRHRYDEAAAAFRQAAELQENADFSEISDPPAWYYPVRRDLAAALLAKGDTAGAHKEAEAALAYRAKDAPSLAILNKTTSKIAGR